jgi:hypothetical protein
LSVRRYAPYLALAGLFVLGLLWIRAASVPAPRSPAARPSETEPPPGGRRAISARRPAADDGPAGRGEPESNSEVPAEPWTVEYTDPGFPHDVLRAKATSAIAAPERRPDADRVAALAATLALDPGSADYRFLDSWIAERISDSRSLAKSLASGDEIDAARLASYNRRTRERVDDLVRTLGVNGAEVVVSKVPCLLVSTETGRLRRAFLEDGRLVPASPSARPAAPEPED